jgi:predicted TIM-barrel enzyme
MNKILESLGLSRPLDWNRKLFFVVIHLPGPGFAFDTAFSETMKAWRAGADGVFLICHGGLSSRQVSDVARFVMTGLEAQDIAGFPVGVNWLRMTPDPRDMIYEADECGIRLIWSDAQNEAASIMSARESTKWPGQYWGAFAFKYQTPVANADLPRLLERAFQFMDVPITSGEGTGEEIDLEKARICREAAGNRPIGVASGVRLETVNDILPFFDVFLVSTSLQTDFYHHDEASIQALAKAIRQWRPE